MLKSNIFLAAILFVSLPLAAQDNPYNEVSIASPTAAALGKYVDVPVNNHTGIPTIDIPLYTVQEGPLTVPISLSYHASGLKVLETACWVGAGWSLIAGGVISRTVRGAPDERMTSSVDNQQYGYFSDYGYASYNHYTGTESQQFLQGKYDGEPDLFTFTAPGLSGKFYFRDDRVAIFEPEQNIKVDYVYTGTGSIQSFVLTAPNGTRYHFGIQNDPAYAIPVERTNPVTPKAGYVEGKVISSWYLSEIESQDGLRTIRLNYIAENYSFYTLSMFPIRTEQYTTLDEYEVIKNVVKGVRLSIITFGNGTVTFNPGAVRQDLSNFSTALTP